LQGYFEVPLSIDSRDIQGKKIWKSK